MEEITQKQITEWAEELKRQISAKEEAQKDLEQANTNINALQGGIQFGQLLLKKNESSNQPTGTVELDPKLEPKSSKSKGQPT